MTPLDKRDGCGLIGYALVVKNDRIGCELRAVFLFIGVPFVVFVVENDQRSARLDEIKQTRIRREQFRVCFIAAVIDDYGVVERESGALDFVNGYRLGRYSQSREGMLKGLIKTGNITNAKVLRDSCGA